MSSEVEEGFEALFNGSDLTGWFAYPRVYGQTHPGAPSIYDEYGAVFPRNYAEQAAEHPAIWTVEDGAIVGRQNTPGCGYGGYLTTERTFGDFELRIEAKPDWPADTGILVRKMPYKIAGLQILVDHRRSGGIGGFYGSGIGAFHAISFNVDAVRNEEGEFVGLKGDDPATSIEPTHPDKTGMLSYGATLEEFLAAWRDDDWNDFRIRVEGGLKPYVTTWINETKIAEIDMATLKSPLYDSDAVAELLGPRGHIALEVHDNDWGAPDQETGMTGVLGMGWDRWGKDAACRYRNVRIKEL